MRSIRTATMFGGASLLLILIAIIVSGVQPHSDQDATPSVLNFLACGLGIVSAMTFLTIPVPGSRRSTRLAAALVGGGALVLLVIELLTVGESGGGADIGQGLVRLIAIGALLAGVLVGWGARGRPGLAAGGGTTSAL